MLLKPVSEQLFDSFLHQIVVLVNDQMQTQVDIHHIVTVLTKEAPQFQKTITHGQKLLDELIQ